MGWLDFNILIHAPVLIFILHKPYAIVCFVKYYTLKNVDNLKKKIIEQHFIALLTQLSLVFGLGLSADIYLYSNC